MRIENPMSNTGNRVTNSVPSPGLLYFDDIIRRKLKP